jgi:hypothetical protein
MAKPIKETPILKGKDAKKFIQENSAPKDSFAATQEKERILKNYNLLKSAETFNRHIPA